MSDKPKRRWYQFSLKWMLLLITVLCLGPGTYVAYEQKKASEQIVAAKAIEKLGGHILYGDSLSGDGPVRSAGMRWLLGDNRYEDSRLVDFSKSSNVSDLDLSCLKPFHQLAVLDLTGTQVTDSGLALLAEQKEIRYLNLSNTRISDAGLPQLVVLKKMMRLDLKGTQISDDGLDTLKRLASLETLCLNQTSITDAGLERLVQTSVLRLDLCGTRVTDAGLAVLARKVNLEAIYLTDTLVTTAGTQTLQRALPKLNIYRQGGGAGPLTERKPKTP